MLRRPRWRSFVPIDAEVPIDRAVMARAFALLYGAGATLVLVTLALSSDKATVGLVAPPIAAYGVVLLTLIGFDRLPLWLFTALPGFGAVLVTIIALSATTETYNAYSLLYFWVVVSAFYFFGWQQAAPSLALCAIGYGLVLLDHSEASERLMYWVAGIGTLAVTGLFLGLLRRRVERLVRALRESDLLKTTILRSVSHDLRTPLTAIIAAGESTGSPSLDAGSRRELSSVVVHEAVRLSDLVDNLLDISKLEAGAAVPRQTWCSIEEVIEAALERMGERGDRLEITTSAEGLPPIWADAAQLERAFTNLFENSSRFSAEAAVEVVIGTRSDPGGDRVVVSVSDHGPGFETTERERIFEPFYRGRADGNAHRGPGLGLAIVKGFIEANGGSVRAESRAGQGATFVVELPVGAE
jgi:signal transduction histidine kinase